MNSTLRSDESMFQSLYEGDLFGWLSDQKPYDEAPIGVDNSWLQLHGGSVKPGSGIDLFPDLIDLEQEDDNSPDWMEDADVKQLLQKAEGLVTITQDVLHNNDGTKFDQDILSSALLIDQLTPPESPDPQIAPEIFFDQRDLDTIMTAPLSPLEISHILDTPTEPQTTREILEAMASSIQQPVVPQPVDINQEILQSMSSFTQGPMETMDFDSNDFLSIMVDDVECLVAKSPDFAAKFTETPTQTNETICTDVSSPETSDKDDDPDYTPTTMTSPRKVKGPSRVQGRKKVSKPYAKRSTSSSVSNDDYDVLNITMNKKERKKLQNKTAATRYREKKRDEKDELREDEDSLERKNKDLLNKVEELSREIGYMKNLLEEVTKMRVKMKVTNH